MGHSLCPREAAGVYNPPKDRKLPNVALSWPPLPSPELSRARPHLFVTLGLSCWGLGERKGWVEAKPAPALCSVGTCGSLCSKWPGDFVSSISEAARRVSVAQEPRPAVATWLRVNFTGLGRAWRWPC